MTELLTAAQMRAIEQAAIDAGDVTGVELMERAGEGVVDAIFSEWPVLASAAKVTQRAVILCGPGNNGGDGFVVARLLRVAGWTVEVFFYGDADKLPPDAWVNYERWGEMGLVLPYDKKQFWSSVTPKHNDEHIVLIEALFGMGQDYRPGSALLSLVIDIDEAVTYYQADDERETGAALYCISVDTPVNANSDTGIADGWIASYDLLVTFHANKVGHLRADIEKNVKKTVVVDIGL